jgi:hypothetical protein
MIELGLELAKHTRRKLQAQDTLTDATARIVEIEERLRSMTPGQFHRQPGAERLPLPHPGEGTRMFVPPAGPGAAVSVQDFAPFGAPETSGDFSPYMTSGELPREIRPHR